MKRLFSMKTIWNPKNNVFNKFLFLPNFFVIASYQILQNDAILINDESFIQETKSPQLYRSQFLEINSLRGYTTLVVSKNRIFFVMFLKYSLYVQKWYAVSLKSISKVKG